MKKILKLRPYLEKRIWGGSNLEKFGIDLKGQNKIGEAWAISGYEGKSSVITNLDEEIDLYTYYNNHRTEFKNYQGVYPLLIKLLDANDDLSIQVHPDDGYAKKHHNGLGKEECWYILDCKENAQIIYGHNAKSEEEFAYMVTNKKWDQLLKHKNVKKDDFIYVPAKTIHAIKSGVVIYELQQSSDITYRLYDYDRLENGKLRELHLDHSLKNVVSPFAPITKEKIGANDNFLVNNRYFTLTKIEINKKVDFTFKKALWLQISVIGGNIICLNNSFNSGESFLVTNFDGQVTFDGSGTLLISYVI